MKVPSRFRQCLQRPQHQPTLRWPKKRRASEQARDRAVFAADRAGLSSARCASRYVARGVAERRHGTRAERVRGER
jgi:hypothetical protein